MNRCPWCGQEFKGQGWRHPDEEEQALFDEAAEAWGHEDFEPEACTESCWRFFMEDSYWEEV